MGEMEARSAAGAARRRQQPDGLNHQVALAEAASRKQRLPETVRVQRTMPVDGDNKVKAGLTMEEKLLRWQQAKLEKQKTLQCTKRRRNGGDNRTFGEKDTAKGGVKRRLEEVGTTGCLRKTSATVAPSQINGSNLSTHKKPHVPPDYRNAVPKPAPTLLTSPCPAVKGRSRPESASASRLPSETWSQREGSLLYPIIIDSSCDLSLTSPRLAARSPVAASVRSARTPKSAPEVRSEEGSPHCPIVIGDNNALPKPVNRSPPPIRDVENLLPMPNKIREEFQNPTKQSPVLEKATEPMPNDREMPTSVNQAVSKRSPVLMEMEAVASKPRAVWSENPAFDKENQSGMSILPNQSPPALVATVEKKPELLAKDLIRVAIGFEKKRRLATAFCIFKRASHILPKESTKLTERLERLQQECLTTLDEEAPSQELCTAAYMVKVLERDLLSVLNHGTKTDLTALHAIGAKRAELVLDKRPYHQLEELQRVPGMSANVIARLYQHHTNWENHQ